MTTSTCLVLTTGIILSFSLFQRMFKKFEEKESVSGVQQLKSSVQKGIRNSILDTFPDIADYLDGFLPKKDQFKVVKCHDHVELLINSGGDLLFWRFVLLAVILSSLTSPALSGITMNPGSRHCDCSISSPSCCLPRWWTKEQ